MHVKVRGGSGVDDMRYLLKNAPELLSEMSQAVGNEALGLVLEGFNRQADPYGKPWEPKKVDDGRLVLHGYTTNLKRGWKLQQTKNNMVSLSPSVSYAAVHQEGFSGMVTREGTSYQLKIPQRMMIPSRAAGLPNEWMSQLKEAVEDAVKSYAASAGGGGAGMSILAGKMAGLKRRLNIQAIIRRAFRSDD